MQERNAGRHAGQDFSSPSASIELQDFATKVPAVTLSFWVIKIAATTLGETGGDTVSMTLHWGYLASTALFLSILAVLVVLQTAAKRFHPFLYWATIIASTTAGTTMADFADRSLGIGYAGGSSILFACVIFTLGLWYWSQGSISVDTVNTPKVEAFYWAAITFSQTLGTALGDEEGDEESSGSSSGAGDESGKDSGQSMEDDTDDGESAESTTGENGESGEGEGDQPSDLDYDDYKNNQDCAGSTQNAFERGVDSLRNASSEDHQYSTIPSPNLDEIVVDYTKINKLWVNTQNSNRWNDDYSVGNRKIRGEELRTFQNSIKGTVAQMVQQFQMKQAAEADKRTEIAKTGILDTVTMINYRWSEDIFLKNEVHPDGKSHGMIMYVDWSGSMAGILQDTIEQLLVLVEFCRKVNIPYEVYAFSSNEYCPIADRYSDEATEWYKNRPKQWTPDRDTDCSPHTFALYNFLSSRMNKREYQTALNNLWLLTGSASHYTGHLYPNCLSLGCTPLNEAVVCAIDMVPAFQRANNIEIVNTVFLTDGEGHGMIGRYSYRNEKNFVTDKKTKKTYDLGRDETAALLNMLRDRCGTNLVGIRLHDGNNINHLRWNIDDDAQFEKMSKQYKTQNYVTLDSAYDEYFIVKGNLKVETDALEDLEDDASYTRIKNAFIKGGTRKKSSRVIAAKMADIFAA